MSDAAGHDAGRHDIEDRVDVEDLVRSFYRDAAVDDLLGPVFAAAGVDWPAHIERLTDFWAWQLLGQRGYEGNPLRAHAPVHASTPFTPAHHERWFELFSAVVDDRFAGPVAEAAKQRAARMNSALARLLDDGDRPGGEPGTPVLAGPLARARFSRGSGDDGAATTGAGGRS